MPFITAMWEVLYKNEYFSFFVDGSYFCPISLKSYDMSNLTTTKNEKASLNGMFQSLAQNLIGYKLWKFSNFGYYFI